MSRAPGFRLVTSHDVIGPLRQALHDLDLMHRGTAAITAAHARVDETDSLDALRRMELLTDAREVDERAK